MIASDASWDASYAAIFCFANEVLATRPFVR